jgi:hypothetical protein
MAEVIVVVEVSGGVVDTVKVFDVDGAEDVAALIQKAQEYFKSKIDDCCYCSEDDKEECLNQGYFEEGDYEIILRWEEIIRK